MLITVDVVQNEDRQTVIAAFDKAAAAPEEAAKRFEKTGNKASSRFYRAKAKAVVAKKDPSSKEPSSNVREKFASRTDVSIAFE